MQYGRSRDNMEFHNQESSWDRYTDTKRHGKTFWKGMDPTMYIQEFYKATKGRASKAFRPSKSKDNK